MTVRRLTAIVLLAVLCVALAAALASAVEKAPDQLFREALAATGDEYLTVRDRLVAGGEPARAYLVKMKASEKWQERLLAEILLERIASGDSIRAAVDRPICFEARHRDPTETAKNAGEAIAKSFEHFPLVLAEYLWKRNELSSLPRKGGRGYVLLDTGYGDEFVVYSLGFLKEKRALDLLFHLLKTSERGDVMRVAGAAIGMIGESSVLRELIWVVEEGRHDAYARTAAWHAIPKCADAGSVWLLRRSAARARNARFRRHLLSVAAGLPFRQRTPAGKEDAPPSSRSRPQSEGSGWKLYAAGVVLGAVGGFALVLLAIWARRRGSR